MGVSRLAGTGLNPGAKVRVNSRRPRERALLRVITLFRVRITRAREVREMREVARLRAVTRRARVISVNSQFNDNTRIKLQHPYNYTPDFYTVHETDIEGSCVSLQKARRKRRHDYPDAEVETERGVPHSLRRRRKIVAALKLPRPRERRNRRKRRLAS